jgi:diguanylate cyclase
MEQTLKKTDRETAAMLNTAQSLTEILIPQNTPYVQDGIDREEEITGLRRRIEELENELMQVYRDLIHERKNANIDQLTGIPNRRAYQTRLQEERLRSQRENKPMCLLVWDIDHFKKINDRYGHQMGDKILSCVAKKITQRLRGSDFTARFGGEEFVSLLPDCDAENALQLAEQIRQEIGCCDQTSPQEPIPVTLSCGIAEVVAGESDRELFARADVALYRAKNEGRDRSCLA